MQNNSGNDVRWDSESNNAKLCPHLYCDGPVGCAQGGAALPAGTSAAFASRRIQHFSRRTESKCFVASDLRARAVRVFSVAREPISKFESGVRLRHTHRHRQ